MYDVFRAVIEIEKHREPGFRSREPDGSKTLRHPVDILLLDLMKAYVYFLITLGTLLKGLFTNLLYFELWDPGAGSKSTAPKPYREPYNNNNN